MNRLRFIVRLLQHPDGIGYRCPVPSPFGTKWNDLGRRSRGAIQFDVTPFLSGQIDALPGYVTNQPVTLRGQGVAVEVISAASQGLNYYGNVYFTSEKMLREHPERVKAFLAAVRHGWTTAFDQEATAVAAVEHRATGFKAGDLELIYKAVVPFIHPDDGGDLLHMSQQKWTTTREVLQGAALLKDEVDVSGAYTNEF